MQNESMPGNAAGDPHPTVSDLLAVGFACGLFAGVALTFLARAAIEIIGS